LLAGWGRVVEQQDKIAGKVCWRDGCKVRLWPPNDLGLCPEHIDEMREW